MPRLFLDPQLKSALYSNTIKRTILIAIVGAMLALVVFRLSSIYVRSANDVSKSGSGDVSIGESPKAPPKQLAGNKDVFKELFPTLASHLPGEDRHDLRDRKSVGRERV